MYFNKVLKFLFFFVRVLTFYLSSFFLFFVCLFVFRIDTFSIRSSFVFLSLWFDCLEAMELKTGGSVWRKIDFLAVANDLLTWQESMQPSSSANFS